MKSIGVLDAPCIPPKLRISVCWIAPQTFMLKGRLRAVDGLSHGAPALEPVEQCEHLVGRTGREAVRMATVGACCVHEARVAVAG